MKPLKTVNIQTTLQEFASDSITPLKQCDFILHGVTTYIRTASMSAFGKYGHEQKERYKNRELLIKDRVIFRQAYSITLYKQKQSAFGLVYEIEKGEHATQPLLILDPSSTIPYENYQPKELFALLTMEINKIKAFRRMLMGIFSDAMVADIKKLIKLIYTKSFTQKFSILLFNGIEPELAEPSRLIRHYAGKNVDRRIKEVEEGELIVEFIKPIFGKNGLNAYGRQVRHGDAQNEAFLSCKIDDGTIKTLEDDTRIKLFSKKRGYVHYDEQIIEISNKIILDKVKRVESQVAQEEKNEIELHVTQNDLTEDSVGEGVFLTSETIHITGYVADKAKLEAKTLFIDGASHNGAVLFAKEATVNRHKGVLRCHKASVTLLEGGEIHATHVHVDTALGGTIYAEHITIGHVKHHLKAYATKSITIEKIGGEDNLLMIDYKKIPIIKSHLEYIEEDIDELRYHLEEAKRHRKEDIPKITKKITAFKAQADEIKGSSLKATITIKEVLNGLNTIAFALPDNKELRYRTAQGMRYEPFRLECTEEEAILLPVGLKTPL